MKPLEIAYDCSQPAAKWLRWLFVVQGLLFISMFGLGYYENNLNWVHFIELFVGISFVIISVFFYKQILFNHSSAVLSDQGLLYTKKWNDEHSVDWSNITSIKFSSDALVLNFTDASQEELKFPWLNYKERQQVKKHLEKYAEAKNISYSYKF